MREEDQFFVGVDCGESLDDAAAKYAVARVPLSTSFHVAGDKRVVLFFGFALSLIRR